MSGAAGKTKMVGELGEQALLLPSLVNEALSANDRAKYLMTLIQAAKFSFSSARWFGKEAEMGVKSSGLWCGIVLTCLIVGGCQKPNTVLSAANYRQKFDEVEAGNRARPGDLAPRDIEAILGPGEAISAGDADLANPPPGVTTGAQKWSRWSYRNEVLLVGFTEGRVASVVRLRR